MKVIKTKSLSHISSDDWTRFKKHLRKSGKCLLWTGLLDISGYGRFRYKNAEFKAHRVAWFVYHGKQPKDLVLHSCDHPACVLQDHLFEGDLALNAQDRNNKGRTASGNRNGSRIHPEKLIRGDAHWMNKQSHRVLGEGNNAAKITEQDVRFIRKHKSERGFQAAIAIKLGLSRMHVNKIAHSRVWRHVL